VGAAGGTGGGENGLADLQAIIQSAPPAMAPGALLALETGVAQHAELSKIAPSRERIRAQKAGATSPSANVSSLPGARKKIYGAVVTAVVAGNGPLGNAAPAGIFTTSTRRSCFASGESFFTPAVAPKLPRDKTSVCAASAPLRVR